jgi:hypothetical protein
VVIGATDFEAYNDSIRHTIPEIVDDLRVALGAKLVAYIVGVSEIRTVREWAEAARKPTAATEERLRLVHRVVTLISQSEGQAVVPTWFQGMNPQLEDRSPARVLHEDSFDEAGARVLAASNAFVGSTDRQPSAVERIISRHLEPDQINASTITPNRPN